MPRKPEPYPYICFAPPGESHSSCQKEPFSQDDKVWIGYRHQPDESCNGHMTFGEVLAQAAYHLSQAIANKPRSLQRAKLLDDFPGIYLTASKDTVQQLDNGHRVFKRVYCLAASCKDAHEELQMETIPVTATKTGSDTATQGFLIGYVFDLRGHEMVTICRDYTFGRYRFQREDGSVNLDMFLRTKQSKSEPESRSIKTEHDLSTRAHQNKTRRSTREMPSSDALYGDVLTPGSSTNMSSPAAPDTTEPPIARASPVMPIPPVANNTDAREELIQYESDIEAQRSTPAYAVVGPDLPIDEYRMMIFQISRTYGASVFIIPDIADLIKALGQAVTQDDRDGLCQTFAKIMTSLLAASAPAANKFLEEEHEDLVSSAVAEFGMDLLTNTAEGGALMDSMAKELLAGRREGLSDAFGALRSFLVSYRGRS
ncbi:hypothetical protein E4T43_03357 [Aureobasidium subglaciale]|nr:hypothetical protein E4T43_03357 [Aureobasidium subglaciale]